VADKDDCFIDHFFISNFSPITSTPSAPEGRKLLLLQLIVETTKKSSKKCSRPCLIIFFQILLPNNFYYKKVLLKTINRISSSILIVEDDEDDIFILRQGFDELEYSSVSFFTDVISAINYLEVTDNESLPTLIVTDFNLPGINGFQFVKLLKNHPRLLDIPVIVLTTSMSAMNRKLFLDEGVSKVIIKPDAFDHYKLVANDLKKLANDSSLL
jgi:CheY-like chemotaxis protein